jgi:hypothetical protein
MSEIQLDDNDLKPLWLPDDLLQRIDAADSLLRPSLNFIRSPTFSR